MRAHLETLPTETLRSLVLLTGELRVQQYLRALTPDMLRALLLKSERERNIEVSELVRTELRNR